MMRGPFIRHLLSDVKEKSKWFNLETEPEIPNNIYEVVDGSNPFKMYLDLDGELDDDTTEEKFNEINDGVIQALEEVSKFAVMEASSYNAIKEDSKTKKKTIVHKLSYSIHYFNKFVANNLVAKQVASTICLKEMNELIGSIIPVTLRSTVNTLNIDTSVYRTFGKMRGYGAYKHDCDKKRFKKLITHHNWEHTLINIRPEEIGSLTEIFIEDKKKEKKEKKTKDNIIKGEEVEELNKAITTTEYEEEKDIVLEFGEFDDKKMTEFLCEYIGNESGWIDWDKWNTICCVLKYNKYDEDVFIEWSKLKNTKKTTAEAKAKWKEVVTKKFEIAAIFALCREGNPDGYKKFLEKHPHLIEDWKFCSGTADDISVHFMRFFGKDFLYDKEENRVMSYNGLYWDWHNDCGCIHNKICNEENGYMRYINKLIDTHSEILKKMKPLIELEKCDEATKMKYRKYHARQGVMNEIRQKLKGMILLNQVSSRIKAVLERQINHWELNKDMIVFTNKVYDINKNRWIKGTCREDLMKMNTGYDFVMPTAEQRVLLKEMINDIFMNEEERIGYMIILSTGLEGLTLDRFTLANGGGANGKNVINDMTLRTLGNYAITINPAALQAIAQKDGANPELANIDNKRLIIMREPDANKPFNIALIKTLTGGGELNARKCHSNRTVVENKGTYICECNTVPKIEGAKDNAVLRRIINYQFKTTFKNEPDITNPYQKQANYEYTEKKFQLAMRGAMFLELTEYYQLYLKNNKKVPVPQEFITRTEKYLFSNDVYALFIAKEYEPCEGYNVSLKESYELFENCGWIQKLSLSKTLMNLYSYDEYEDAMLSSMKVSKLIKDGFILNHKRVEENYS